MFQGDDLSCKAKTGVWDLAPTNKNKMLQEQNQSKLDQDSKIGKTGQKNEDDNKLSGIYISLLTRFYFQVFFLVSIKKQERADIILEIK